MRIADAVETGLPLVFEVDLGDDEPPVYRVAAEVWLLDTAIAWVDVGWNTEPGGAAHMVEGMISGNGPWMIERPGGPVVRKLTIRPATRQIEIDQIESWARYRRSADGRRATRAAAARYAYDVLGVPIPAV